MPNQCQMRDHKPEKNLQPKKRWIAVSAEPQPPTQTFAPS